jgi:hypothetical protein
MNTTRADIDALIGGELGRWLAEQDAMRSAAREKSRWRMTWGAAVSLPILAFVWFGPLTGDFSFLITAACGFLVYYWSSKPIEKARRTIKGGINSAIAQSLGMDYQLEHEPGDEFAAALTYGLVPKAERSSFEDRWHGSLEGHDFNLYEAHLEERRGTGRNRHWVTLFRGVIIQMAFGRPFHSTTLLQRAGKHRKWFGFGGERDSVKFEGHQLDRVDQVHPAFADTFALFSDDQVEARVLVHPSYVEKLLEIEQAFKASELRALFRRGEVVLAVEADRNLFESGSMDAAKDRQAAETVAEQFASLAGLALAINETRSGGVRRGD